jgi:hypothetical protein
MGPEEGTTKRTKATKEREGEMENKEKIRFGGTVQKSAVPCGFREYGVAIAECKLWIGPGCKTAL